MKVRAPRAPSHMQVLSPRSIRFQWSHPPFPATILSVDLTRPVVRAPELPQAPWVNALEPLTMTELLGRVVMVDIWDFTRINCLRTMPYLRAWYDRYADYGFEIIGVHTPEFLFARDPGQVKAAVGRLGIRWPVILDKDQAMWRAYANRTWPTIYLVDMDGYLRYRKSGEGAYARSEAAIQSLLLEMNASLELPEPMSSLRPEDAPGAVCAPTTPELRIDAVGNTQPPLDEQLTFQLPAERVDGRFYLDGTWRVIDDGLTLESQKGSIILPYHAASVNAVLSPSADPVLLAHRRDDPLHISIAQDGGSLHPSSFGEDVFLAEGRATVRIDAPRMYTLVRNPDVQTRELCLSINDPGLTFYAFSFGTCITVGVNHTAKE